MGCCDIAVEAATERTVEVRVTKTSGASSLVTLRIATLLDRGVYKQGDQYEAGDRVSFGGSMWIAQFATTQKPGTGSDWRLVL